MGVAVDLAREFSETSGVSEEAERLGGLMNKLRLHFLDTATGENSLEVFDRLEAALAEYGVADRDGYGGAPIDRAAFERAWRIAVSLPDTLPAPDVVVEPDGDVALEWCSGRRRVFALSLDADSQIRYAGVFGTSSVDGKEYFAGTLPREILRQISRVYDAVR